MKNSHVNPIRASGTPSTGQKSGPLANMPANNNGTFPVKLGAGQASKFGQGVAPKAAQNGVSQPLGQKANIPANNTNNKMPKMGNTKHGVGEVPGYLKGSSY